MLATQRIIQLNQFNTVRIFTKRSLTSVLTNTYCTLAFSRICLHSIFLINFLYYNIKPASPLPIDIQKHASGVDLRVVHTKSLSLTTTPCRLSETAYSRRQPLCPEVNAVLLLHRRSAGQWSKDTERSKTPKDLNSFNLTSYSWGVMSTTPHWPTCCGVNNHLFVFLAMLSELQ